MDTKTMQCMWILNINDTWKNRLVKYLKTENFSVLIDQASIKYQSSQADSNIKHILHQNQWAYNLGWPQQDHTQYNVQSLAKSNLCSVCN